MPGSYRDILARRERRQPDGTPVWPLRFPDRPAPNDGRTDGVRPARKDAA